MCDDGYEIHSILEFGDKPAEGLWWVLSPAGNSPPIRAGAGSLVIKKKDEEYDESIVFSGGATPAGYLSDIVKLDLIHGEWQNVSNQVKSPNTQCTLKLHCIFRIFNQDTSMECVLTIKRI